MDSPRPPTQPPRGLTVKSVDLSQPVLASVFVENHLAFVMSSESNLRNYLVHALEIDATFVQHFSVPECVSALEHTLRFRPPDTTTETYLKAQRLWIMHKLLMQVDGVREKIQFLLGVPSNEGLALAGETRIPLSQVLIHFQNRIGYSNAPIYSIAEELTQAVAQFQQTHYATLQEEKRVHVERRCEIIRYCAWLLCHNGKPWLMVVDGVTLQQGLHEWLSNRKV